MFNPLNTLRNSRACCMVAVVCLSQAWGQVNTQLNTLTANQRTRIVWVSNDTNRLYGGGSIQGYDSDDNSVVQILPASTKQNKPILCSGGYRVVVSRDYQVYVVNWDGTGLRLITSGIASDVWLDPATGLEWVFVRKGRNTTAGPIIKYQLDNPNISQVIWGKTPQGDYYMNWYQVSANGMVATDFLPWDHAFVIDSGAYATNGFETGLSRGCWSSLASDNSYYWFNLPFAGLGHSAFNVFRYKDSVISQLPLKFVDGTTINECYHPRFASNGGGYVAVTGDWQGVSNPYSSIEIYLGKFNSSYTGFDGWVRITNNTIPDFTPDAWVGVAAPSPSMRFSTDTLVFSAPQGGANPTSEVDSITTPNGTLSGLTATTDATWLTVSIAQSGTPWLLTATPSVSGLSSGLHRAVITVRAPGAVPALRTVSVKFIVTGTPVASSIEIAPANAMIAKSGIGTLTATVYDQMEQIMSPQPAITWSMVAPAGGCSVIGGTVTAGTTTGLYSVVAATGSIRDTALINVVDFIPVHLKLNCGDDGPGYIPEWAGDGQYMVAGHTGTQWLDDQNQTIDVSGVPNPPPRDVYVKFRSGSVWYSFPAKLVPPGHYRIRLHYNEQYTVNTARSINCSIEGTQVMTSMRIITEAGGVTNKAIVKEYDVTVNSDGLQIQFGGTGVIGQGMEIISSGSLAKEITLLSPLGGQTYQVGQAMEIRWSGNPSVSGVALEVTTDNGLSWNLLMGTTIGVNDPQWGAYRWVIPATLNFGTEPVSMISDQVLVRVRKYTDPSVYDASSSPMKIIASSAAAGNGRRAGAAGRPTVRWTRDGVSTVIPWKGAHTVELFGLDGRRIAGMKNDGASASATRAANQSIIIRVKGDGKTAIVKSTGGK